MDIPVFFFQNNWKSEQQYEKDKKKKQIFLSFCVFEFRKKLPATNVNLEKIHDANLMIITDNKTIEVQFSSVDEEENDNVEEEGHDESDSNLMGPLNIENQSDEENEVPIVFFFFCLVK